MEKAKERYKSGAPIRRIGLKAEVWVSEGQPLKIAFRDADGYEASAVTDFVAETALKRPLSEEVIRKQVDRLGSSIFALQELVCHIEGAVMVPMSEMIYYNLRYCKKEPLSAGCRIKPAQECITSFDGICCRPGSCLAFFNGKG